MAKIIAVVTPVYNCRDFIEETILSVVHQPGDFDIVYHIQDGGSTDGTVEILEKWRKLLEPIENDAVKCNSVKFSFSSEPDSGIYDAVSKGFAKMQLPDSAIMTWINADDILLPRVFQLAASAMNNEINWVGGVVNFCDAGNSIRRIFHNVRFPTEFIKEGLCDTHFWSALQQEGSFWTKSVWDEVGGLNTGLKLAGDWDLWRRFAQVTRYYQFDIPTAIFTRRIAQASKDTNGTFGSYLSEVDSIISRAERENRFRKLSRQWYGNLHYHLLSIAHSTKYVSTLRKIEPENIPVHKLSLFFLSGQEQRHTADSKKKSEISIEKMLWYSEPVAEEDREAIRLIRESELFDYSYFAAHCNRTIFIDPLLFFYFYGKTNENPNPMFDMAWYVEQNPEVRAMGCNAVYHYIKWGADQNLPTHPSFDSKQFVRQHPEVRQSRLTPLAQYLRSIRKKRISVVTVCFNAASCIQRTIESVVNQTFQDFEYIVIDGGSTDDTVQIIQRYRSKIDHFVSEKDEGIYHAMNKGIAAANGVWINFMNAGDTFAETTTLAQVAGELDDLYSFVYGDRVRMNPSGSKERYEIAGDVNDTLTKEVVFHQSLFTKTALLKSQHYDKSYLLAADYKFVVENWLRKEMFKKVSFPISKFREGGASRQKYLVAQLEAMRAVAGVGGIDIDQLRQNIYFQHFVSSNFPTVFQQKLAQLRQGDEVTIVPKILGNTISFQSDNLRSDVQELIGVLNQIFNEVNLTHSIVAHPPNAVFSSNPKIDAVSMQREQPMFSVITVTYNAASLVEQTIRSVMEQRDCTFEYIVIDGESSDGTVDQIIRYQKHIDHWISEPDAGIYDAMNKGIKKATGQYVIFMNAGDTFASSTTLAEVWRQADPQRDDVLFGDRYYVRLDGKRTLQKANSIDTIFEKMPFGHQSCFVKRDVIQARPFNITYKYAADYDMMVDLYSKQKVFRYIELPVCHFLQGGASESGVRPYIEVLKILHDNCKDTDVIARNLYYKSFKERFSDFFRD